MLRGLRAGACGYLLKDTDRETLFHAIRAAARGDLLPQYDLPWLECVSGQAFGFLYVRDEEHFLALTGDRYHLAGEHLLHTLHYAYSYTGSANSTVALARLEETLRHGPVVAGMLDMGYLSYDPGHRNKRGSDHAVVILELHDETVLVHDPAGYVAVPLPLANFLCFSETTPLSACQVVPRRNL